ncbi:hypothetical protein Tco_0389504, partial [Tanacetum coccineum]
DIDDSLYVYGKYGPQPQSPSPTVSNVSSIVFSICPSNDSDGELGTITDHSVNNDSIPIPSSEQIFTQKTQSQVPTPPQTVDPSCAQHVKPPRQLIRTPVTSSRSTRQTQACEGMGFAEIVDFLRGSNLRYALTANPTIYDSLVKQFWQSAVASTREDGSLEISATVDTKRYIISEASIRDSLQLDDATGISMLPNDDLFEGMGQIGYPTDGTFTFWKSFFTPQWRYLVHHLLHCLSSKSGGWDQFGSNIATALICLSTGRVYNFSKLIFDGMMANLKNKKKFLMYPRFLQIILNIQTENKHPYLAVSLTKKIFGNMKRGFQGAPRPLLPSMLLVATNPIAGQEHAAQAQTQPIPPPPPIPSPTPPPIPTPTSPPPPPPETEPSPDEHINEEQSPVHHHFSPSQAQAPSHMPTADLLQTIPKLISRIDSLELDLKQTKLTMGNAIVKLVKKVKKLEGFLKRRNLVLTDSEDEEPEVQGRNSQADPQDSSKQGLVTPPTTKTHASGEEQEEDISPNTLEDRSKLTQSASFKVQVIGPRKRQYSCENKKKRSMTEQQEEKKSSKIQFEAQQYTNLRWDLIRAKLEAKMQVIKNMLEVNLKEKTLLRNMVELVIKERSFFAEKSQSLKGTSPMTQITAKNLHDELLKESRVMEVYKSAEEVDFEEVKEEFGEELQTKTSKRLKEDKDDEAEGDAPTKKLTKRRKQIARKVTETTLNPVPVAMKHLDIDIPRQYLYSRLLDPVDKDLHEMQAVPPPMTGNYMPSGPDIEIDDSQYTYGPEKTQPSESESQTIELDTCESNISTEPSELVSEPVVNESNIEVQPKVWSDAPIIEEYESDSDDEYVSVQTKGLDTPSFANKQVKTPRENVKNQSTHSQKPKVNNKELGHGFTERACFVCGSFSHLIRDCDYHVKLAKQVELNKQNMSKGNGTGERKPDMDNVQRTVLTSTALKVNNVKPIVNDVRPANVFHKTHSPSSRPFKSTTVQRTSFSNQKVYTVKVKEVSTVGGKWDTAVKSSAGCKWRTPGYNNNILSKYNGGSSLRIYSTFKDPLGRLKPKQAWSKRV